MVIVMVVVGMMAMLVGTEVVGTGGRGRGAGRRDRKVCRELGENHTPHVGTEIDTPGGCNWGSSLLVALIFFENLS